MKYFLVVVFLFVGVTCFGKDGEQGGHGGPPIMGDHPSSGHGGPINGKDPRGPTFYENLSEEALKEHNEILLIRNQSIAALRELERQFGAKYDIEDRVNAFHERVDRERDELKEKVGDFMSSLNQQYDKYFGIQENQDLTPDQISDELDKLFAKSPEAANALIHIMNLDVPREGGRGNKHGKKEGKKHGKKE